MRNWGALEGSCERQHGERWASTMAGLGPPLVVEKLLKVVLRARHTGWRRVPGNIFSVTCVLCPHSFFCCFLERTDVPESWTRPHFHFRSRCPPASLRPKICSKRVWGRVICESCFSTDSAPLPPQHALSSQPVNTQGGSEDQRGAPT